MKVAIDTFGCDPQSGVGAYLLSFIANIPQEHNYEIELFGSEEYRYTFLADKDFTYTSVRIPAVEKKIQRWHKHKVKRFIKKNKYDVVIFPSSEEYLPSKFKGYTGVAVINSIPSFYLKHCSSKKRKTLKKGLQNVQKIVATSNLIKKNLVEIGINEKKIKVIPNGIDHKLFYPIETFADDIVDIKPFAIKRPYFIYGSSLSNPEKRHIELIQAFNLFKKNTGLPHRLVLAGKDGEYSEKIREAAFNSQFASDILITGHFSRENIAKLYASAEAAVLPSDIEGSGLPVIEAFACGVPVICSKKGALQEVGGTAPLYFNSEDVEEIAAKLQEVEENKTLRYAMISEGIRWASKYDWETTVSQTLNFVLS